MNDELKVFSGTANRPLAEQIAAYLGTPLGRAAVDRFPDGETAVKSLDDVRGRDVFVVQPTCPPVNDNLMELLIHIDCLRRTSKAPEPRLIPRSSVVRSVVTQ